MVLKIVIFTDIYWWLEKNRRCRHIYYRTL